MYNIVVQYVFMNFCNFHFWWKWYNLARKQHISRYEWCDFKM